MTDFVVSFRVTSSLVATAVLSSTDDDGTERVALLGADLAYGAMVCNHVADDLHYHLYIPITID